MMPHSSEITLSAAYGLPVRKLSDGVSVIFIPCGQEDEGKTECVQLKSGMQLIRDLRAGDLGFVGGVVDKDKDHARMEPQLSRYGACLEREIKEELNVWNGYQLSKRLPRIRVKQERTHQSSEKAEGQLMSANLVVQGYLVHCGGCYQPLKERHPNVIELCLPNSREQAGKNIQKFLLENKYRLRPFVELLLTDRVDAVLAAVFTVMENDELLFSASESTNE